jgi:D-serine deaminase-like pyridoxal phosphate-dependent protein
MPTLLLDKERCLRNIEKMAGKADHHRLSFRPHCKTHQSATVGSWFREFGISRITVSSFRMAEYFAGSGWRDILVAFPLNPKKSGTLDRIADKCNISILVDNPEILPFLISIRHRVKFYIDIDTGYGRTGVKAEHPEQVEEIIRLSGKNKNLEFAGFYCHAGHSYRAKNAEERSAIHAKAIGDLNRLKEQFRNHSPRILYGDTPNCSTQADFDGIDEITPGNFVFYDLFQHSIGSCGLEEIAVAMACPLVSRYPENKRLVIHGGAVHFSKETVERNGRPVYGQLILKSAKGWEPYPGEHYLDSISQEHGVMENTGVLFDRTGIGDQLYFLPVHSCLTANLMKEYVTLDGEIIDTIHT